MSYVISQALQQAVYGCLQADTEIVTLTGGHIHDAPIAGPPPPLLVLLGAEKVVDQSTATSRGARHDFLVSVVSDADGFSAAKTVAGLVSEALVDAPLVLTRGVLVGLTFVRAAAKRGSPPEKRRIDLAFRAFVEDSEDS